MGRWVGDFETTTDPNDCRIWAWAVCNIDNPYQIDYGIDGKSFLKYLIDLDGRLFFHNLGFDGRFILDLLLSLGFRHTKERDYKLKSGEFNTLISQRGKFYSISIATRRGIVSIRDSLKLLPMSVDRIAKSFNLPDDEQKGSIDYEMHRPIGYKPTDQEWNYIRNDVLIVARALRIEFDAGLDRMTAGSNAFHGFKEMFGKKEFTSTFPVIEPEVDSVIRKAYRGGFTYCDERFKGVDVGPGISCDFNSMYPSVMLKYFFPVGKPVGFDGEYKQDNDFSLYVQALTCTFRLKKNGIPMIQLQGNWLYAQHEYLKEVIEPASLVLTSVDLKLFFDNYDVFVMSWDGGYKFRAKRGLFDSYITTWRKEKETSTGGRREIAKLMLNSLYGKFGTNTNVTQKIPYMDEDKVVRLSTDDEEIRDPIYIPVAAFVTAYARDELIRAIMANRKRFIYCDTDSLHLLGVDMPKDVKMHDTEFGCWKFEGIFQRARHIRAKCYIWDLNDEISIVCAGMPSNVKRLCNFDNFHLGFSNLDSEGNVIPGMGKLIPKPVPGGVVLDPRPYRLR